MRMLFKEFLQTPHCTFEVLLLLLFSTLKKTQS